MSVVGLLHLPCIMPVGWQPGWVSTSILPDHAAAGQHLSPLQLLRLHSLLGETLIKIMTRIDAD